MKYDKIQEVELNEDDFNLAIDHSIHREENVFRRFVPVNNTLNKIEMNYIGALGEIVVQKYLFGYAHLEYLTGADDGDIKFKGRIYDVKSSSIPEYYYNRIYNGTATEKDTFGYGLLTTSHIHHVENKYDGIIFVDFSISPNIRNNTEEYDLRENIIYTHRGIILGWVSKEECLSSPRVWKTPYSRNEKQFHSENVIFFYKDMNDIREIKNG